MFLPLSVDGQLGCFYLSDVVNIAAMNMGVTLTFPLPFLQLLYEQGISLRASFSFLSICSAWHVGRTFLLMPRGHIPYPLPAKYSYG